MGFSIDDAAQSKDFGESKTFHIIQHYVCSVSYIVTFVNVVSCNTYYTSNFLTWRSPI